MKKRILSFLLCLLMVAGMLPPAPTHADDFEPRECWLCDHVHYSEDDFCSDCGACDGASLYCDMSCWETFHCWNCGACLVDTGVTDYCEDCHHCQDCMESKHCTECGLCDNDDDGDNLCPDCHRCGGCSPICTYCGYCEECWADADDTMHCSICGDCYEVVGFPEHDGAQHCPYCCVTCDQCGDWETCTADDPEMSYCDICGLCINCCEENRNASGPCMEYCVESTEYEDHFCESCGNCWCDNDRCDICGLCMACCENNSDCFEYMCVEDSDYDGHFCENCGACTCEVGEFCETCGMCIFCCADERLIQGCDCDPDAGVCAEDTDFEEHLAEVHPDAEPAPHSVTPKTPWNLDDTFHWKDCRYCDDSAHITSRAVHSYDASGRCTVCGYLLNHPVYITSQPKSVTVKVSDCDVGEGEEGYYLDNTATFRISAYGKGLSYQWYYYDYSVEGPGDAMPVEDAPERFSGAQTRRLTVCVSTEACQETWAYFCLVWDENGKSAESQPVRLIATHRYSYCGNIRGSGGRTLYFPNGTHVYNPNSLGHNWYCCGECHNDLSTTPTRSPEASPHRYGDMTVVQLAFSQADANAGYFSTYYRYTCLDCGYKRYQEKHTHNFETPVDPDVINELLDAGEYVGGTHPLLCTEEGCGEMRHEAHEWTYRIAAYPTASSSGALQQECRICGYWQDKLWTSCNPDGSTTSYNWDRSNMLLSATGGTIRRTVAVPGTTLTLYPEWDGIHKCTGWTAVYTDYSYTDSYGTVTPRNITITGMRFLQDSDGSWSCTIPSFSSMGVTGGGWLRFTAKTEVCDHSGKTELVGAREPVCVTLGYTGDTVCKDCGHVIATGDPIPAGKSHTGTLSLIPDTARQGDCRHRGYEGDYRCSDCQRIVSGQNTGYVHQEKLLNYVAPTCTEGGYSGDVYCTLCDRTVRQGRATAPCHNNTELRDALPATCTSPGYTGDTVCVDCGDILKSGYTIHALGHDWDEGTVLTPATITERGEVRYTCTRSGCGATKVENTARLTAVTSANYILEAGSYAVGQRIFDVKVTSDAKNVGILPLAGYNQGNGIAILTEDPKTTGIASVVTDPEAVFEAGKTYYLGVTASVADGFTLSALSAANVTLNGKQQAYTLLTFRGIDASLRLLPVFRLDPLGAPAAPSLSSSIVTSTGKIKLSWNAIDGAVKYYIYRCTDGNSYKYYDSTKNTTYTNTSVTPGTTYYYKVVAVTADGTKSDYSNRSYRTADCAKPSVSSSNVSTGGIKLTWNAVDGAVKYYIYRSTDGGKNYSFYDSTKNTTYTNKSVTPGNSYYYKVKAICSNTNGNSAYSNVANRTADCIAPKVSSSNVSTGGIKLTWSAVDGASKYYVYRSTDGENYKLYDSTTKTTYSNKSVTPGTTYYYKLVAVCGKSSYGNSAYSNVASRTADCVTPTLTIQLSSGGKPQLKWSAIDGASKYYIYRSTDGKSFSFFDSTTKLSYTNTGAKSGTTYYYKLVAVCGKSTYGNSAYSNIVSIKSK